MLDILCLHFALVVLIPDSCIVRATCCVYCAYCFVYLVKWNSCVMVDCVIVCPFFVFGAVLAQFCSYGTSVCELIPSFSCFDHGLP